MRFLDGLRALSSQQWRQVGATAKHINRDSYGTWDAAWDVAWAATFTGDGPTGWSLELDGDVPGKAACRAAMQIASSAGADPGGAAVAGAAACALALQDALDQDQLATLYAPFAQLIPSAGRARLSVVTRSQPAALGADVLNQQPGAAQRGALALWLNSRRELKRLESHCPRRILSRG